MAVRRIYLALQGGGAHGAFAWGVLDRLLDEDWLDIAVQHPTREQDALGIGQCSRQLACIDKYI